MQEDFEKRNYAIFLVEEVHKIDFSQVLETSEETLRLSYDKKKTFVKWEGKIFPECIQSLTTLQGLYTYEEMMDILSSEEWKTQNTLPTIEQTSIEDE